VIGVLTIRNTVLGQYHLWYYSVTEKGVSEFCHNGFNTVNLGLKKGHFEKLTGKYWKILEKDIALVALRI